jgi:hypothetical protein
MPWSHSKIRTKNVGQDLSTSQMKNTNQDNSLFIKNN